MSSSTLEKLQELKDAKFHALGDEILPSIESRYHPIVPYGRNKSGDSIIGQPDSYVGNSAKECSIAIQYTVEKQSWWLKAINDVKEARKACPLAKEIVIVLPRDIDRQKPKKGKGINWFENAKKAAKPAELSVIHGQILVQQLDTISQDLRLHYLGTPYSRLSWNALVAGCTEVSAKTITRLRSLERYDSERYIDRIADDHLFGLWQESLRNVSGSSSSSDKRKIIPLIADSGIGKTSLLARFAERASPHGPVLFLLARDLSFENSDALIKNVINSLLGILEDRLLSTEESHIVSIMKGKTPITIVLDGLDETTNVGGLRRAISSWIWSKLGRKCVLIVSSRPEFWRKCKDESWSRYILKDINHPKAAKSLRHEKELSTVDPMQGIDLPGKFSLNELSKAWLKGGQREDDFWKLSTEIRNELLHPFTLRTALDLIAFGTSLDDLGTRTLIINEWLQSRFKKEINVQTRLTESQFQKSLLIISKLAVDANGGWVSIDNLQEVPRFERSNPPGVAVEALISANILETHPERGDQIRFSFEAVQDFFLAEAIINEIENDPESVAKKFAKIPFSVAVTRLERIGDQITSKNFRDKFIRFLAELDGPKSAVVLKSAINAYSLECREIVVAKLAELLNSKMLADQALACQLLGRLICEESKNILKTHWLRNNPNKRIHSIISSAAISHGIVELIPIVFKTWWFTRENFFVDIRPELIGTTQKFRDELSNYCLKFISKEQNLDNYQRALMILSYLNDERAVDTINKRTENEIPFYFESLCLLAVGTLKAIKVYSRLLDRYIVEKEKESDEEKKRKLWYSFVPHARTGNLITDELEVFVSDLIVSNDLDKEHIGCFIAEWLGSEKLLIHMIANWNNESTISLSLTNFRGKIGAESWINLWEKTTEIKVKKALISIAGNLQNIKVEEILIECLDNTELAGNAVQSLRSIGSQRSCPAIRKVLFKDYDGDSNWVNEVAFSSLAALRDPASVHDMVKFLESDIKVSKYNGAIGLASIGTEEAENALLELKNQPDEFLVRGLVHFGSSKCINKAIEIAKQKVNGKAWLAEHCRYGMWGIHGRMRRQYRTDIEIEPFLDFVLENEPHIKIYDYLRSLLNDIDRPAVRKLFSHWYNLKDSDEDITLDSPNETKLSEIAFHELVERGDDHVLSDFIEMELERYKEYRISDFMIEELTFFEQEKVQQTLRKMYQDENSDEKSRRYILDLIGHLGDKSDVSSLNKIINEETGIVANAAYEAKLRLTDPIRLAENW